jgi:flagellar assembly protein FliH
MLSRILIKHSVELTPLLFRDGAASCAPAAPRNPAPGPATDAGQLRARVAELEAAQESQTRQSYAAGLRAGEESARKSLEPAVRDVVQKFAAAVSDLAGTRPEIVRRAEADTVRLAIEIARRVLHREIAVDASSLEALIKAALEKLQSREIYRVRVHPAQEKVLRACLDRTGRGPSVAVVADPSQPEGTAVFETARGALDASLDTQLAEIERGLVDQLETRA